MNIVSCIVSTALLVAPLALGSPQIELDRAAAATAGTQASFTQRFTPRGFKTAQVESGTVLFGRMPMMRWTYSKPEQKLFVFDGRTSWFYVPAEKQVTVARIDDARRRDLPFLVLGDAAARQKLFRVSEKARGAQIVTTLEARTTTAAIRTVAVTIDKSSHRIQRIEYSDRDGNRTVFDFSGYQARAAGVEAFRFTPPAGVQIVNAE